MIVHLFEKNFKASNDAFKAYEATIKRLKGAYATLLITKAAPGEIFFAKNAAPLIVAKNDKNEIFFS